MSERPGFRWATLMRRGPLRWGAIAQLRAVHLAVGIVVPLVVGSWLVRPGAGERGALGERFAALVRYASDISAGS